MNNEDNQFMTLAQNIKNMTSSKQQLFYIGAVISISPLVVDIGELQLDREDLIINKDIVNFNLNDKVVLITNDQQLFILLCIVR